MSRLLIVDDDAHILRTLQILLRSDGHDVLCSRTAEEALALLEREPIEVALVDLQLPGMNGAELLRQIRDLHRDVEVVIITAHGSTEATVETIKDGAFDYLPKPFTPDQVRHRLRQIKRIQALKAEVAGLRLSADDSAKTEFLTRSPALRHLLEVALEVAASDATVLITGETGTGKNLLAGVIHRASARRDCPFITVDCTTLRESLLESELFGHVRGAFTGAISDKIGKVATADGGTVLLDEVGEIPLQLQGKLLRLVEDRVYERVGDPLPRTVDARLVAATNRDLDDLVREKGFREDLFFRLSVVELTIPPLRSRPADIPLLAGHFLGRAALAHGRQVEGWDEATERALVGYSWPGNIRELAHAIERAVLLASGRSLRLEHLPTRVGTWGKAPGNGPSPGTLAEMEETQIRRVLELGHSQAKTARLLGIDPSTLWRKRRKYGI